jgi:hypothetical protein
VHLSSFAEVERERLFGSNGSDVLREMDDLFRMVYPFLLLPSPPIGALDILWEVMECQETYWSLS